MEPDRLLNKVTQWAKNTGITGLALIGSYARGEARADSDIDLILVTPQPSMFINEGVCQFGTGGLGVYTQGFVLRVHPQHPPKPGCRSDLPLI